MAAVSDTVAHLVDDCEELVRAVANGELQQACTELRQAIEHGDATSAAHAEQIAADIRHVARISDAHPDLEIADALLETARLVHGTLTGNVHRDARRKAHHSILKARRWFDV